jgi:hypothetical protein
MPDSLGRTDSQLPVETAPRFGTRVWGSVLASRRSASIAVGLEGRGADSAVGARGREGSGFVYQRLSETDESTT